MRVAPRRAARGRVLPPGAERESCSPARPPSSGMFVGTNVCVLSKVSNVYGMLTLSRSSNDSTRLIRELNAPKMGVSTPEKAPITVFTRPAIKPPISGIEPSVFETSFWIAAIMRGPIGVRSKRAEKGSISRTMPHFVPRSSTRKPKDALRPKAKGRLTATWTLGQGMQNCGVHTLPMNGMSTHT